MPLHRSYKRGSREIRKPAEPIASPRFSVLKQRCVVYVAAAARRSDGGAAIIGCGAPGAAEAGRRGAMVLLPEMLFPKSPLFSLQGNRVSALPI